MKISPIINSNITNIEPFKRNNVLLPNTLSFGAKPTLLKKNVTLSDVNGNEVKAQLIEQPKFRKKTDYYGPTTKAYCIKKGLKNLGYIIFADSSTKDCIMIHELFTHEHASRTYKGAGTELLKAAVQESFNRGYNGRAVVFAAHNPPPYVFYYKNNFRPYMHQTKYIPLLDFAASHPDVNIRHLMPNVNSLYMRIDEDGARALINGIQLYKFNK